MKNRLKFKQERQSHWEREWETLCVVALAIYTFVGSLENLDTCHISTPVPGSTWIIPDSSVWFSFCCENQIQICKSGYTKMGGNSWLYFTHVLMQLKCTIWECRVKSELKMQISWTEPHSFDENERLQQMHNKHMLSWMKATRSNPDQNYSGLFVLIWHDVLKFVNQQLWSKSQSFWVFWQIYQNEGNKNCT